MRVELTNGASAELLDSLDGITNDERDSIEYAYAEAPAAEATAEIVRTTVSHPDGTVETTERIGPREVRKLKALSRRVLEIGIVSWTLELPLPKDDPSVLGRITARDGKLLEEAAYELRYSADPLDTTADGAKGEDGELQRDAPFLSSTD